MRKMILGLLALWTGMAGAQDNHNFDVAKNMDVFNAIYRNLDMMYVDTLDSNDVIKYGIDAMLHSLDPYTAYYPEEDTDELKQMLTGKYAGIGALIRENLQHGCTMIDVPYADMPAREAGLRHGDLILAIDDSTMVGKPTDYVSSHLRGEPGSTFELKIRRLPSGEEKTVMLTRRTIKLPPVTWYGIVAPKVGYLELNQFTDACSKDVRRAIIDMKKQGAESLIFDLRGNGGGSLSEAVQIVNMFIARDELVVKLRGKMERANNEYRTTVEPLDSVMPIVMLVGSETASASEITAGTLQDLDRAVILGQRTYGKGLVQSTMDLPYNGNMKFTTAKYYIPSGRCIQAINYKRKHGRYEEHVADSLTQVFYTRGGRMVRDGGGIKPDVEVKPDTLNNMVYYLFNQRDSAEMLVNYNIDYREKHPTIDKPDVFELNDEDYDDFCQRVLRGNFSYDKQTEKFMKELVKLAQFEGYYDEAKTEFDALEKKLTHNIEHDLKVNEPMLRNMLANNIIRLYYGDSGSLQYLVRTDNQVKAAIELLGDKERYQQLLRPAK